MNKTRHEKYLLQFVMPGRLLEIVAIIVISLVDAWVCSLSHVRLLVTPSTVATQAPLSMEFSRQEYWSGLLFLLPGDLPDPGIELVPPALSGSFFTTEPPGKPNQVDTGIMSWSHEPMYHFSSSSSHLSGPPLVHSAHSEQTVRRARNLATSVGGTRLLLWQHWNPEPRHQC